MIERVDQMNCSKCTNVYYNIKSRMTKHTTTLCRNCLEKYHTLYIERIMKEQQMTEQNKILIDPSEYKNLKEGDEIEITVKGTITSNTHRMMIRTDLLLPDISVNHLRTMTLNKILPKATPLEVGEIVTQYNTTCTWKVLHINKRDNHKLNLLNMENDISFLTGSSTASKHTSFERESGIPIDWEATFK